MNETNLALATDLRHQLHAHPEKSMEETTTKARLMDFLQQHTHLELHDMGRWFYALYRAGSDRPTIALRADMDALPILEDPALLPYASENPGVSHKCGHDGHSAALAAFGLELEEHGAGKNVLLLFQHAEETGQGAKECRKSLAGLPISEIYAVHNLPNIPLGSVAAPSGTAQFASTGMILAFQGQPSHACYPENGKNPAYAISELVLRLQSLTREKHYRGMTLITVIEVQVGEHAFGTSAGAGRLLLTVRGAFSEELEDLTDTIEAIAREKATEHGRSLTVTYEDQFPDTYNHPKAAEKVLAVAEAKGIPTTVLPEPFRASEDFGVFTKAIPGAIFYVGCGDCAPIHTVDYDFPDAIIPVIVEMYRGIVEQPIG